MRRGIEPLPTHSLKGFQPLFKRVDSGDPSPLFTYTHTHDGVCTPGKLHLNHSIRAGALQGEINAPARGIGTKKKERIGAKKPANPDLPS